MGVVKRLLNRSELLNKGFHLHIYFSCYTKPELAQFLFQNKILRKWMSLAKFSRGFTGEKRTVEVSVGECKNYRNGDWLIAFTDKKPKCTSNCSFNKLVCTNGN